MRKFVMLLTTSVVMVLVTAGAALAQEYPPEPGEAVVTPGQAGVEGGGAELAITGSNTMWLVWLGLAALMLGIVLVIAARRRAAIRTRSVPSAVA